MQWDMFLAHAGPDQACAEELYDAVGRISPATRVFLDSKHLRLGDVWPIELPKALKQSRMTVVLVSSRVEKAYYVQEEIVFAVNLLRTPGQEHRVIPVYLEGAPTGNSYVPYGLRVLHGVDAPATGWPDGVARKLVAALGYAPQSPPLLPIPSAFDREQVFDRLLRFLPAQLDAVIIYSGFDAAYLTPGAPPATRAAELIHLGAQSPEAGQRLSDAVAKVGGHTGRD